MNNIKEYEYLWNGSSPSWVLLHVNSDKIEESPKYLILDTNGNFALIIEDDKTFFQVIEKMLEEKVKIVTMDEQRQSYS